MTVDNYQPENGGPRAIILRFNSAAVEDLIMAKRTRQKPIDGKLHPAQLRAIALAKASRYYKEADKREAIAMDAKINPTWEREFCKTCKAGKDCLLHPKEEV